MNTLISKCAVAIVVALALSLAATSCAGPGGTGGSPLVAAINGDIEGIVRTDGEILLVRGRADAMAEIRSKFGGLPVVMPLHLDEGGWIVVFMLRAESISGGPDDPLPIVTKPLFSPAELADPDFVFEDDTAPPLEPTPQPQP
jgi:hypothetical protein